MMYIQITTRCNMTCDHCCFACTIEGEDMDEETYAKALELCDSSIVIGGGEPTLHPLFWHLLIDALTHPHVDYVWLATNGSQTAIALKLSMLARKGIIGCALSQDSWHDEIDEEVIYAFESNSQGIRDVSDSVYSSGRAKENDLSCNEGCGCTGGIIKPNGDIRLCGCIDAPVIGTVWDPKELFDDERIYNDMCWTADCQEEDDDSEEEV